MVTLIAIVLFGSIVRAQAASYFISASGPLGNGSGSSAANAADASTPDKFYAINQAKNTPGTVIVYAPGTYLMRTGFWMFSNLTHQGAGIDKTIIRVENNASPYYAMWNTLPGTISGWQMFDMTLDLNASNQNWWSSGSGQCTGISFTLADHCTIQRVKFINMGSKGQESFMICFNDGTSSNGNENNVLIDSCIFTQPIPKGNTNGGLTCILNYDVEPGITVDNTNVVSNCQFLDLNRPTYSDISYVNSVTSPVVTNNYAQGVDSLWFIEPGSLSSGNQAVFSNQTCQVTGNTLDNAGIVAHMTMHPSGSAGSVLVQNNNVGMMQSPYEAHPPTGVSIESFQPGNPSVGNVTVQNNTFTAPLPMQLSPSAVIINPQLTYLFHLASLSIKNNRFVNFPGDGSEIQVNTAQVGTYTNTGNTFGSAATSQLQLPHHRRHQQTPPQRVHRHLQRLQ